MGYEHGGVVGEGLGIDTSPDAFRAKALSAHQMGLAAWNDFKKFMADSGNSALGKKATAEARQRALDARVRVTNLIRDKRYLLSLAVRAEQGEFKDE